MEYFNYPGMMGFATSPYHRGGGNYFNAYESLGTQQENAASNNQGMYSSESGAVGAIVGQENPHLYYDQNNPLASWSQHPDPLYGGYKLPRETMYFHGRNNSRMTRGLGYSSQARGGNGAYYQQWRSAHKHNPQGQQRCRSLEESPYI